MHLIYRRTLELDLDHFWVLPDCINQGVGRQMFTHLIASMQYLNFTKLRILSDPNAVGFYQKMGAQLRGEEKTQVSGRILPLISFEL